MAKSTWSDEGEKALLCLLQKKGSASNSGYSSGSSIPPPLESQGSMTDGSKRLRDAMADDGFDLVSVTSESAGVQLPMLPTPLFPGIADKDLDQIVSDHLPGGMSLREWSCTKFVFGSANLWQPHQRSCHQGDSCTNCNTLPSPHQCELHGMSCLSRQVSVLCACKAVEVSGLVGKPKGCFAGISIPRQLGD